MINQLTLRAPAGRHRRAPVLTAALVVTAGSLLAAIHADPGANLSRVYPYLWLVPVTWAAAVAWGFGVRAGLTVAAVTLGPVLIFLGVDFLVLRTMGFAECGQALKEFISGHRGCNTGVRVALGTSSVVAGMLLVGTGLFVGRRRSRMEQ